MKISIKQATAAVLMAAVPALGALAAAPQGFADAGASRGSGSTHSSSTAKGPERTAPVAGRRSAATPRPAAAAASEIPDFPDFSDLGALPELPVIPESRTIEELRAARSPFDPERKAAEKAWIDSFDAIGSAPTDRPEGEIPPADEIDVSAIINDIRNGR